MTNQVLQFLQQPITHLKGVGEGMQFGFARLKCDIIADLLFHLPIEVLYRRPLTSLSQARTGETVTIILYVREHHPPSGYNSRRPYKVVCQDAKGYFVDLVYFGLKPKQLETMLPVGSEKTISGKLEKFNQYWQMIHPDYVGAPSQLEHWQGYQPVYPLSRGLTQNALYRLRNQIFARDISLPEWLPLEIAQQLPTWSEALKDLHFPKQGDSNNESTRAQKRLALDELFAQQLFLQLNRRQMRQPQGTSLLFKGEIQATFLKSLPFSLTRDQQNALQEILEDLRQPRRMVRLLQGDVGSGKTVVAFAAMLAAVEAGKQAALLAPTEILAQQHYQNFFYWCQQLNLHCILLKGGRKKAADLAAIAAGQAHIVVGTHAVIQENVIFKDLALAIVDEQHRFGVNQRLALAEKGREVDLLVMSATPIPRTLLLAGYGDLDVSTIAEKPAGRQTITTSVMIKERIPDLITSLQRTLTQGEKVYWICPLIEESEKIDLAAATQRYDVLHQYFGDQVGLLHGRMRAKEKEDILQQFVCGTITLLVSTTVVEVGVDVTDANIMIIEQAERFGLAQLHQLRGRVGRGDQQAQCILLYDHKKISPVGRERLQALRATNDGFALAEADLRLRGGGEALGERQSGMPHFRLADLSIHYNLLYKANQIAKQLLATDPHLLSPQGQAARILCQIMLKDIDLKRLMSG